MCQEIKIEREKMSVNIISQEDEKFIDNVFFEVLPKIGETFSVKETKNIERYRYITVVTNYKVTDVKHTYDKTRPDYLVDIELFVEKINEEEKDW